MKWIESIKSLFLKVSFKERVMLVTLGASIILITLGLIAWVLSPSYSLLFKQLDADSAAQMVSQLDSEKIRYRLSNHGRDIYVSSDMVDKTRLKLMAKGIKSEAGFELFDKNDFGMTDFSRKINYQRALQGELERTISALDEVRQARVHLVLTEEHLFKEDNKKPHAAVTLKLVKPLSKEQIISIQQLIASSVPGLVFQDVTIVDQHGINISQSFDDGNQSHLTLKKNTEHYLRQKILHLLERIFSEEDVAVVVDVNLNYDEFRRESVIPQQEGRITHEKETRHALKDAKEKSQAKEDISREKNYEFGTEKVKYTRASGYIEKISISVAIPEHTSPEVVAKIETLIKATLGFNGSRGDVISVEPVIRVRESESVVSEIPSRQQRSISMKPVTYEAVFGFMVFLMLVGFWWRLQIRRKRGRILAELKDWLEQQ